MSAANRRPEINMSAIPVTGIGGLGLLAMAVVVAWVIPAGRWLLGLSAAGGAILGLGIVLLRRYHKGAGPSGDHPQVLFQTEPSDQRPSGKAPADAPRDLERLLATR